MNLKIKVLSFGRSSKDSYSEEINRFIKMSRPWASVEFTTLKPYESNSESVDSILGREAKLLKKNWSDGAKIVSLGEEGRLMNSCEFAAFLQKTADEGKDLIFNIGSACGLADEIKKSSDLLMSLSPLTFPYKLCKLIFAEQIYRGLSICCNHPYHKE